MFQYQSTDQNSFPICVSKAGVLHPCHEIDYTMTEEMPLEFTFLRASKDKAASNKYSPADFVWKYEMELVTSLVSNKIVHGYFKLSSEKMTVLNLANKYDRNKLKWIRFTCFDPNNPQRRAWFIPLKGLKFTTNREPSTHHIAKLEITDTSLISSTIIEWKETPSYFNEIWAVESKYLKFWLDGEPKDNLMYCYFLQACSRQQDMEKLQEHYEKFGGKDSKIAEEGYARKINYANLPERYLQNVHGYFKLKAKGSNERKTIPTRIDLCNSWDKKTVAFSTILTEKGVKIDDKKFVFFYAIKFNQAIPEPVKIEKAPKSINSEEVINEKIVKSTSRILDIDHASFICQMQEDVRKID